MSSTRGPYSSYAHDCGAQIPPQKRKMLRAKRTIVQVQQDERNADSFLSLNTSIRENTGINSGT